MEDVDLDPCLTTNVRAEALSLIPLLRNGETPDSVREMILPSHAGELPAPMKRFRELVLAQFDALVQSNSNLQDLHPKVVKPAWRKLSPDQVAEVKRLREAGATIVEIAKKFSVSDGTIHRLGFKRPVGTPRRSYRRKVKQ